MKNDECAIPGALPAAYHPEMLDDICEVTGLTADFSELAATARIIAARPALSDYAIQLYREFSENENWNSFETYFRPTAELGARADQIFMLTVLSGIPTALRRYRQQGIDARIIRATLDFAPLAAFHRFQTGALGIFPEQVSFGRNLYYAVLYRLGRFQYKRSAFKSELPTILRHRVSKRRVLLATPDTTYDAAGFRSDDDVCFRTPPGQVQVHGVSGHRIRANGTAAPQAEFFANTEYDLEQCGKYEILDMHIPPGGGMTAENALESWRDAWKFFGPAAPAIHCNSWVFNPRWGELNPVSHLAEVMRLGHLFPVKSAGDDGLFFLFGHDRPPREKLPRNTSMRRMMLDALANGEKLRSGGLLIFADDIMNPIAFRPNLPRRS